MNKKISIYELLGLIKDGKAPLKIEFNFKKYYLNYEGEYVRVDGELIYLSKEYNILTCLNDEIEIIEEVEDKEYEDIEEITLDEWAEITYSSDWRLLTHDFNLNSNTYTDKINALIRNQKYILEQLKNEK